MNAPEQVTRVLNLHQRINEVRKTNDYIKKDKRVDGGGYMAVTHDAVTAALRDDLIEQGVLVFPSVVPGTTKVCDTGTKTSKGIPFIRFEAEYDVAFVNVDDPKDREVVRLPVHAIDHGDKAPGKALSYCVKGAFLKVFNIETGEDDEARPDAKVVKKTISPTDGALEALKAERREFCERIASGIVDYYNADQLLEAYKSYEEVKSNDERIAIWGLLKPHSKIRSALKKLDDQLKMVSMGGQA